MFDSYLYIFIYLNANTSIMFIKITSSKKKKKKEQSPHVKSTHSYPEIFMFFFFLNSLKHFKKILSKFYTVITNPHPSTLMYIILFWSNLNFFYLSQFLSQSINSNVTLDFNFLQYQIALI